MKKEKQNTKKEKPLNHENQKEEKASKKVDVEKQQNTANGDAKTMTLYFGHDENVDIWQSFLVNKMFAHRGLHGNDAPENSLLAFKRAIDAGLGIELDVNPIEDGTPVVFHDSKMSRMTGKDKYIQNITWEEFEGTRLLNSDEKIPTLEEVLKLVDGRTPLLIEIKSQDKIGDLEKRVLDLLRNYKGEYAVQSFNPYTLKWFYQNEPRIWRGQLSSFFKGEKLGILKKAILKRLATKKMTHQNFVSYDIRNLPNRWTRRLEVPLLAWTVKKQEDYIKAIQHADNVIFEGFEPKI